MEESFRHEAVLYLGEEEFLADTLPFVAEGLEAGEPIMVAVEQPKIELLKRELGGDASRVRFRDMLELGRNPARIISAWCDFVAEHREGGNSLRGIGEPAWPGRSEAELEECDHHESLLNVAFGEGPEFSLLCPYDVRGLDTDVVRSALRTHPTLTINGSRVPSNAYLEPCEWAGPFEGPLPDPASTPDQREFGPDDLVDVRRFTTAAAEHLGADHRVAWDFTFAVNELAINSVRHAGTGGTVRIWREDDDLLGDVSDGGHIEDPLVGRRRPPPDEVSGRGLWLVNQLCDLVQIRSSEAGTVVRVRLTLE